MSQLAALARAPSPDGWPTATRETRAGRARAALSSRTTAYSVHLTTCVITHAMPYKCRAKFTLILVLRDTAASGRVTQRGRPSAGGGCALAGAN
eukprot:4243234-Prymnesium_polylepis.1